MIKTAFAHWNNRIAPVFDTAQYLQIIESENGRLVAQTNATLSETQLAQKARRLVDMGIDFLVCGAISRPMHDVIVAYGIQVVPFVAGDLPEVVQAWLSGTMETDFYTMPGCRRRRRCGDVKETISMDMFGQGRGAGRGQGAGGRGQGAGGRGRGGGPGRGRMGGPLSAGPAGQCVCPKCGNKVPHQPGLPCVQRQCPECGTALMRE